MKKKFFSFLIISAVLSGLCGCYEAPPQESAVTETSGTSVPTETVTESSVTVTEKAVPPMDTSPITFSLFVTGNGSLPPESAIWDEMALRTGVTLDITEADGDALEALIASGDLPDLIYAGDMTDALAADGTLIPLDGYMSDFGGNFSAMYSENLDTMRKPDGGLYTFGTGGSSPERLSADGFFQIRYEVLSETGYPEIKTLEQLEAALAAYREKFPKSTGLLLCGAPKEQWYDTVSARISYVYGCPDDGDFFVSADGNVVYKWTDGRAEAYVKWLNGLYSKGLLDKKSFSLKHDDYLDRAASSYLYEPPVPESGAETGAETGGDADGEDTENAETEDAAGPAAPAKPVVMYYNERPAAIADNYGDYAEAVSSLPEEKRFCPLAVTADSSVKPVIFTSEDFVPADGIGITKACKAPERAFRFLDWLCCDEAQFLLNFGTDGSFDPENEIFPVTVPFPMRGIGEKAADGRFYSYAAEKYISGYNEYEKRASEVCGVRLFSEQYETRRLGRITARDAVLPSPSEASILSEALETYVRAEIPNIIAAPEEEFDKLWEEMTAWCAEHGSERLCGLIAEEITGG